MEVTVAMGKVAAMADMPAMNRLSALIGSATAVVGEGDLEALLRRLVIEARVATGAAYAALGVIGEHGVLTDFIHDGIDEHLVRAIGQLPTGRGVLGTVIRENRTIVLEAIGDHPDSFGFPEHHPEMGPFLGVPVAVGDRAFGNLYLTDKPGGFTDDDVIVVEALSRIAGAAVQTARLHARLQGLAVVEERERIARDLHDSVIQELFAVGLALQTVATRLDDRSATKMIDDAVDRLDHSVTTLRSYVFELRDLPRATLGDRLRDLVDRMGAVYPSHLALTVDGSSQGPDDEAILMLASEAISNALRHARASNVEIRLASEPTGLTLEVVDDGVGFTNTAAGEHGMGLANMRTRAAALGGQLAVQSSAGSGTRVTFTLPTQPSS
jgi:signal transduction histidine kinase